MSLPGVVVLAVVLVLCAGPAVRALRGGPGERRFGLADRAGALVGLTSAVTGAVVARQLLPWDQLPEALWALPVAAATVALVGAVSSWRHLPALAAPRWRRAAAAGVEVLADVVLIAVMLG